MTKAKSKKSKSKITAKRHAKSRKKKTEKLEAQNPDCPFRVGTLYASLFNEGNRGYIGKDELINRVAEITGKSRKVVNFAFAVLKSSKHRSNKNRSTMLTEGDTVKLIAIRKSP